MLRDSKETTKEQHDVSPEEKARKPIESTLGTVWLHSIQVGRNGDVCFNLLGHVRDVCHIAQVREVGDVHNDFCRILVRVPAKPEFESRVARLS